MNNDRVTWKSLPPLRGGVWVAMVTDVLDQKEIPNIVKTDLIAGGLGQISGTEQLGRASRIQVPAEKFAEALEIYETLLGEGGGVEGDDEEPRPED